MDAASNHRAHTQGVRRWRKWFGWASIVFFCLFSGMLVYVPWSLDFPANWHAPPPARKGEPVSGTSLEPHSMRFASGGLRFQTIDVAALTADANIREGPSTNTPLVRTIPSGTRLAVTGRAEGWYFDWYQVRLPDGTTGYFVGKLIPPEGAWLLAPAHTVPPDAPPIISPDAPAIVTDPPANTGKGDPHPPITPSTASPTLISPQPTSSIEAKPGQERGAESGLGATSAPLMIAAGALTVSLLGFLSTTLMAWRGDRRAMRAEARAQEEHGWKKAERETGAGFGL